MGSTAGKWGQSEAGEASWRQLGLVGGNWSRLEVKRVCWRQAGTVGGAWVNWRPVGVVGGKWEQSEARSGVVWSSEGECGQAEASVVKQR